MPPLVRLLRDRRDVILSRWTERVRAWADPMVVDHAELLDHMPRFVDELAAALQTEREETASAIVEGSGTAAEHGIQRLRLGFDLRTVVREYASLRDAIVDVAAESGVEITPRQHHVLFHAIVAGIADAVAQYAQQRDAELQRQGTEHFAFIAHELRNPLSSATTALGLLKRSETPAPRALDVLERNLHRVSDLIEHSLEVTRIGLAMPLHCERIHAREFLTELEKDCAIETQLKHVRVELEVDDDLTVEADRKLLRSALSNVLRNAVKFTRAEGVVRLHARAVGGRVRFEVRDQCGGWSTGSREAAFAPFVQLGADRSGFGLGLAIAKQAIDAHGGSIHIEDVPGDGCVLVIELPAHALRPSP